MKLEELKHKKILILGFGREGKDNYLALRKLFPKKILAIADRMELEELPKKIQRSLRFDKKLKLYFGKDYLKALKKYDLIIKTPGIPLKTIKPFLKKGQRMTSQTEIFFDNCPGIIVGVTGTKGKGTTCSLIYKILKRGRLKVHLVGNIGKPVFQILLRAKRNEIFVYELSSHQLQSLKKSPQIAVFLNLYPAHLDFFGSFSEYKKAKENILKWQNNDDFLLYNVDQKILRELAKKSRAKKLPFTLKSKLIYRKRSLYSCYFKGGWIFCQREKIISQKEIPLKGKFNLLNVMAAVLVGKIFTIPVKKIREAIKSFKPLPHRLEFVGKYKGIEFYNDSLATVPQSTIAALEGLGERIESLILGGSETGANFSSLAKKILETKIRNLIFLSPGSGEEIWRAIQKTYRKIKNLKKKKLPKAIFVFPLKKQNSPQSSGVMKEAVKKAYQITTKGKICLLSPASPSFNLFSDYKQRGNLFKKFVKKYGRK